MSDASTIRPCAPVPPKVRAEPSTCFSMPLLLSVPVIRSFLLRQYLGRGLRFFAPHGLMIFFICQDWLLSFLCPFPLVSSLVPSPTSSESLLESLSFNSVIWFQFRLFQLGHVFPLSLSRLFFPFFFLLIYLEIFGNLLIVLSVIFSLWMFVSV